MATNRLNLVYAIKDGAGINIEDVESGLKCGCVCPACGEPLVAKKGTKVMHHFAHHSGSTCEYGYETSLHLMAKDILSQTKKITIPAVYVEFPDSDRSPQLYRAAQEVTIDRVVLEQRYDNFIPDVALHIGGKILFVEIYVTHAIDSSKLEKLKRAGISTIEINLSKKDRMVTETELRDILLKVSDEKTWKYNVVADRIATKIYALSERKSLEDCDEGIYVDHCPVKSWVFGKNVRADFVQDCRECTFCYKYFFTHEEEGDLIRALLCAGKERIAEIEDVNIPTEKRLPKRNAEIEAWKNNRIDKRICPLCGARLINRCSRYGCFLGCKNYPRCTFMAYRDVKTGKRKMKV